jgi:hypothetical protein
MWALLMPGVPMLVWTAWMFTTRPDAWAIQQSFETVVLLVILITLLLFSVVPLSLKKRFHSRQQLDSPQ